MTEQLKEAIEITIKAGYGSVSLLQRTMEIGFDEAKDHISQMEKMGVVGEFSATHPRKLLIKSLSEL